MENATFEIANMAQTKQTFSFLVTLLGFKQPPDGKVPLGIFHSPTKSKVLITKFAKQTRIVNVNKLS